MQPRPAIYGARGANGVVLITTKRGKAGKTSISANISYGFNQPTKSHADSLNAKQYVDYYKQELSWRDYVTIATVTLEVIFPPRQHRRLHVSYGRVASPVYSGSNSDWRTLQTDTDWEKQAYQKNPMIKCSTSQRQVERKRPSII